MLTTGSCNDLAKVFDTTGEFILETIAIRNGVRNSPFLLTMLKQKRIERVVDSKVLLEYDFTQLKRIYSRICLVCFHVVVVISPKQAQQF